MSPKIRIGTRGSALALWQAHQVEAKLKQVFSELETEICIIQTLGDQVQDRPLHEIGEQGLFTRQLEQALYAQEIDIAVHSLKDLPGHLPEGLVLGAVLERENPRDAFICTAKYSSLDDLPQSALVGTGSLRRRAQIKALRSDLQFCDLRGNIETRLRKLQEGQYDAIVMAVAALKRLDLTEHISQIMSITEMVPTPCQGIVAVEYVQENQELKSYLEGINHQDTFFIARAERAFLSYLHAGCHVPLGGFSLQQDQELYFYAYLASHDGGESQQFKLKGSIEAPERLGQEAAERLLNPQGKSWLGRQ